MRRMIRLAQSVIDARASGSPPGVSLPNGEIVDLSHTYDSQTIYWPTAEGFQLRRDADGVTPAGYYYAANSFFTSEHGGTHIDAPVHFAQGHQTVDKIPVDRLIGPAVVIDVTQQSQRDADYQVTTADFSASNRSTARSRWIRSSCFGRVSHGGGRGRSDTWARRCGATRALAICIFPGCIPTRRAGLWRTGGFARSASTRPASTTGRLRCSNRIERSTRTTFRHSRT